MTITVINQGYYGQGKPEKVRIPNFSKVTENSRNFQNYSKTREIFLKNIKKIKIFGKTQKLINFQNNPEREGNV